MKSVGIERMREIAWSDDAYNEAVRRAKTMGVKGRVNDNAKSKYRRGDVIRRVARGIAVGPPYVMIASYTGTGSGQFVAVDSYGRIRTLSNVIFERFESRAAEEEWRRENGVNARYYA